MARKPGAPRRCISDFDALKSRIDYLPETLVWNIGPKSVHLVSGTLYRELAFDALIVCSGATDRLMPVPGWHLAGTYSLGGAQVALKSQGCAIGARIGADGHRAAAVSRRRAVREGGRDGRGGARYVDRRCSACAPCRACSRFLLR